MKPLKSYLRTGALAVGLLGVTAVPALAGASPAVAATAFGSGAAVQKNLQLAWTAAGAWTPPTGDSITYTGTTSGAGQLEFGLDTSSLDVTQDSSANPVLDGYVGVDSPITPTEATNADTAAGSGTQNLLSIPVGQVSEVLELNVPSGITLNSAQHINLYNQLAEEIFAGTVPAPSSKDYSANTWGALLEDAHLTKVAGSPTTGQFSDSGTNGGATTISQVLRSNGAGATLTLKQYFEWVSTTLPNTDWTTTTIDENTSGTSEWPSGATVSSRVSSDSTQATTVAGTGGLVGYGTLGAALSAGFVASPGAGGTHTLFAFLQDNGVGISGGDFANPEAASGASNVYTGKKVNTTGSFTMTNSAVGAGNWLPPAATPTTVNTTGQWATNGTTPSDYTHAWDDNVYNHVGEVTFYPLSILLWDLSWDQPAWNTGNLKGTNYPTPTGTNSVEETVKSYFKYVTGSSGQAATVTPHFAPLPTGGTNLADIQADAVAIAGAL